MVKLLLVTQLDSRDVPENTEGIVPIEYSSQEELIKEIANNVQAYIAKLSEVEQHKPSEEDWKKYRIYSIQSQEEKELSKLENPNLEKLLNDMQNYSNNLMHVLYKNNKAVINGTELDLSSYVDQHSLETRLPEVLTFDQWFDSRLDKFKPKPPKNKM